MLATKVEIHPVAPRFEVPQNVRSAWEDQMTNTKMTREDALAFHLNPNPGKWEVRATVPMTTQRDLSLA